MPARPPPIIFVPLLTISALAFAAAASVTSILDVLLHPLPLFEAPQRAAALKPEPPQLRGEALARITGVSSPPVAKPPLPAASSLEVALLGTLVSDGGTWSFASIEDLRTRTARSLMVGDRIDGAEVLRIERGRVLLQRGAALEYLEVGRGGRPPPSLASVRSPTAATAGSSSLPSLRKDAEGRWSVDRADVERAMTDMNALSRDARILPVFGQGGGFRFTHVRPGSLYTQLGIQSGDVVRRVNGYTLDDPGKLLEVFHALRDAPLIEVEVERSGQTTRHSYRVRE